MPLTAPPADRPLQRGQRALALWSAAGESAGRRAL